MRTNKSNPYGKTYTVGRVESPNCPNLADFVDERGAVRGITRESKIVLLYKGRVLSVQRMANILQKTNQYVHGRLDAAGVLGDQSGMGRRKMQRFIVVDEYIWHELNKEKKSRHDKSLQPCWDCANWAECAWAVRGEPIEGWEAEPTTIHVQGRSTIPSFDIKRCPQYAEEDLDLQTVLFRLDPSYDDLERYRPHKCERKLWRAVIKKAVRDYSNAITAIRDNPKAKYFTVRQLNNGYTGDPITMRDECEDFFRSDYFRMILDALCITSFNGEDFINAVRADPDKYATKTAIYDEDEDEDE